MSRPFRTPRLRLVETSPEAAFREADERHRIAIAAEQEARRALNEATTRLAMAHRQPFMRVEEARRIANQPEGAA
jgi:hypothetical protein